VRETAVFMVKKLETAIKLSAGTASTGFEMSYKSGAHKPKTKIIEEK
jgi:hypothetical protein